MDPYARVVVDVAPAHLDRPFDYAVPSGAVVGVGSRVRVTFAGRRRIGYVVGTAATSDADPAAIRSLDAVDGDVAWFDVDDLVLFRWVADRWAGTLADVLRHALPPRIVSEERAAATRAGGSTQQGGVGPGDEVAGPPVAGAAERWAPYDAEQLLRAVAAPAGAQQGRAFWLRALGDADVGALAADLVAGALAAGRTALVLVPDPASPLPAAVLAVAGSAGVDLRGASDRVRYRGFLRGRDGSARVVVGERGAALAPLRDLGLVLVDDEANPAYKERRAPRHHARDVALARARRAGAAGVVLGDLPSAHLWRLLAEGHVATVAADRATERRHAPRVHVVDRGDPRPGAQRTRFSDRTVRGLRAALAGPGTAVVVAARGGAGAALACQRCRARLACPVCAGSLRPRRDAPAQADPPAPSWECPACAWDGAPFPCTACGDVRSAPLAAGAGRLAQELARSHPEAQVVRMEGFDAPGPSARPGIGVMTRGSVVTSPAWLGGEPAGVVVLPDADAFIGRPSLDASEDGLRLWFAVARWAQGGGGVLLQTREPSHPAVQALVRWDAEGFWSREAPRRAELRYPPAASLVRITVPRGDAAEVVAELRAALPDVDDVLGPGPDGSALVKTGDLRGTLAALTPLRGAWSKANRRVRIDVDPVTLD